MKIGLKRNRVSAKAEPVVTELKRWIGKLWSGLAVQFVLILSVVLFLIAVGVDSLHHPASAAGMSSASLDLKALSLASMTSPQPEPKQVPAMEGTYLEYDANTDHRLRYSDLTSARLTRSRLTTAHMFSSPVH